MKLFAFLALAIALPSYATDRHDHMVRIETRTVYVEEKDGHRDAWAVATAAGIAWWMHRRYVKRHAPPPQVRVVPAACPAYQCPIATCGAQTARAEAACGK
jgi:hypothetical protein